ncbi:MAG: hypothetical protein OXH96_03435 [Spirochaetaceae bacterium]|nr:hypothetical protein [Spirochaetaceae bacterium]
MSTTGVPFRAAQTHLTSSDRVRAVGAEPEAPSPSRPHRRRPGLTIHLLEHGRFRVASESRAFPGWRAEEIHLALNEPVPSAQTSAAVERVAAALGTREGTGPDDDPLLRSQRRQGFERGLAEGRLRMVRQILRSRGIAVSARFSAAAEALAAASEEALLAAALGYADEAEFLAALRRSRHPAG